MTEEPEEPKSEPFDPHRYLDVIRRRHIQFLIPLLVGWSVVWGAGWVLPTLYKSSTLILVEQPTMPKNYVEPNVSDDLQRRLQSIEQQILSRTRLLLIIDKLHLYGSGRDQVNPDEKVERMRKDITLDLVRDSHGEQITAFRVNYSARDPHLAQQVTSELTDLFINENLKVREQESEDTTQFISSQLENARAGLAEQEVKVRQFQAQHEGALPSQQASNLQILSGLQSQLQNEQDALNTAKQQRVYLQSLIEQYRGIHGTVRTADGTPTGLQAIDLELEKLKAQLTDLSAHYTDYYPEVQSVKDEIAKTQKRRDDLAAELKSKSSQQPGKLAPHDGDGAAQSTPALQLQSELQANQAELSNREQSIASLKSRISDYQTRLNTEPAVEQQLADLTRGYDQSKADYDSLFKKKNDSEMATSMEQMQQGERFTMIDPPSLPLKPDFPNRLKFCGIGLGIGLALGVVVAGSFELFDDRMYSEKEIKDLLPVIVLAEIPEVRLPSDDRRSMKKKALGWSMAALVTATILVGSAYTYLRN